MGFQLILSLALIRAELRKLNGACIAYQDLAQSHVIIDPLRLNRCLDLVRIGAKPLGRVCRTVFAPLQTYSNNCVAFTYTLNIRHCTNNHRLSYNIPCNIQSNFPFSIVSAFCALSPLTPPEELAVPDDNVHTEWVRSALRRSVFHTYRLATFPKGPCQQTVEHLTMGQCTPARLRGTECTEQSCPPIGSRRPSEPKSCPRVSDRWLASMMLKAVSPGAR